MSQLLPDGRLNATIDDERLLVRCEHHFDYQGYCFNCGMHLREARAERLAVQQMETNQLLIEALHLLIAELRHRKEQL